MVLSPLPDLILLLLSFLLQVLVMVVVRIAVAGSVVIAARVMEESSHEAWYTVFGPRINVECANSGERFKRKDGVDGG